MTLVSDDLESILNNYADAIEGGNTYRGSGTAYKGIPGVESRFRRIGDIGTLTANIVTPSKTSIVIETPPTIAANEFDRDRTPPYFLLCTGLGANATAAGSLNEDTARKITSYAPSTGTFTTAAFQSNVDDEDTFVLREGFKRIPDGVDIEDLDAESGFDRMFHITAMPGEREAWYGDGNHYYRTDLTVRLRLEKHNRAYRDASSMFQNMLRIRTVLTDSNHRDTCVRAVIAAGSAPEIAEQDDHKYIVQDTLQMIYVMDSTFN